MDTVAVKCGHATMVGPPGTPRGFTCASPPPSMEALCCSPPFTWPVSRDKPDLSNLLTNWYAIIQNNFVRLFVLIVLTSFSLFSQYLPCCFARSLTRL